VVRGQNNSPQHVLLTNAS